jgi:hypothetical protein
VQPVLTLGEEGLATLRGCQMKDWDSPVARVLVPCLDQNQRQELKQRSKEFYVQRNERKGHTERCVVGTGIR